MLSWKVIANFRALAIAAALFAVSNAPALAATEQILVGAWSGEAKYSDTGQFTRCTITAEYNSGISVTFGATPEGIFEIWLHNPNWKLEEGASYPISVIVDDRKVFDGSADALLDFMVYISTEGRTRHQLIRRIRKGYVMRVETTRSAMEFNLDDTYPAIGRLLQCVENNTFHQSNPFAESRNPFGTGSQRSSNPFGGEKRSGSNRSVENPSRAFIEVLKEYAGLSDITFLDESEITDEMRSIGADVYWYYAGTFGTAYFVEMGGTEIINLGMKMTESGDRKACHSFTHERDSASLPNGIAVSILRTKCTEYGNRWLNVYRYFDFGKSILRITTSGVSANIVNEADSTIYRAISAAASN